MPFTLKSIPGFSDLPDAALTAELPTFGMHVGHINSNAAFGMSRCEVFVGNYNDGDTIPLPVSGIDRYVYSREELLYVWTILSSADKQTKWISAGDALWYCNWFVDQATGEVSISETYAKAHTANGATTTADGTLQVFTIAQRQKNTLYMGAVASCPAVTLADIAVDKPWKQSLARALNDRAKFSVINHEVIYMGEFVTGDTVPQPVSPADSYVYSYAETGFLPCWRWTTLGSSFEQPPNDHEQLGPFLCSVDPATGAVSITVYFMTAAGEGCFPETTYGRVAVFAFCTRSDTPTGLALADDFSEIDPAFFAPGEVFPADTPNIPLTIKTNIDEALGTPEFFGPTEYGNAATVPLPVSTVDGYTYSRDELSYLCSFSQVSPGAIPAGPLDHDRLVAFAGNIDSTSGLVTLDCWRLPPGGPYVHTGGAQMKIMVVVMARRHAAQPPTDSSSVSAPSSATSTATDQGFNAVVTEVPGGAINSANQAFTLSKTPLAMLCVVWNGQVRFDFSQVGTAVTTTFTPDTGDSLYAVYFI